MLLLCIIPETRKYSVSVHIPYIHVYMHLFCHFNENFYNDISDTNGGGTTVRVRDVIGTESNVQGLTSGALYTFSITTENAVSFQDSDVTGRTTNATATTEEGGEAAHECLCKLMVCSAYRHVNEKCRRKDERTNQGHTNNKAKQHNTYYIDAATLCIMHCYLASDNN